MDNNKEIQARAVRDGKWWAVFVEIDGKEHATQGKTLKEAQFMAEDLVRIWAEALERPELSKLPVKLTIDGKLGEEVAEIQESQAAAAQIAARLKRTQKTLVDSMRAEGIKVADIAQLLGITKGRVSQISRS